MISHLRGEVLSTDAGTLLLEVGGVGYELHCSSNTLNDITADSKAAQGKAARDTAAQQNLTSAWVYTHVREDCLQLFGFSRTLERKLFLSLIKVRGVGPKMALQILSATRLEQLIEFIEQSDVKALTALPKVGKKTAEQIILSLKGELVVQQDSSFAARGQIVSALLNLGFKSTEVEQAVSQLKPTQNIQKGVREALLTLS